jgi:hypothetical protein
MLSAYSMNRCDSLKKETPMFILIAHREHHCSMYRSVSFLLRELQALRAFNHMT